MNLISKIVLVVLTLASVTFQQVNECTSGSCFKCIDSSGAKYCIMCFSGTFEQVGSLSQHGKCNDSTGSITHCTQYSDYTNTKCSTCKTGYYTAEDLSLCKPVEDSQKVDNCRTYSESNSSAKCDSCNAGYAYSDSNKTCNFVTSPINNCELYEKVPTSGDQECSYCKEGYHLNSDNFTECAENMGENFKGCGYGNSTSCIFCDSLHGYFAKSVNSNGSQVCQQNASSFQIIIGTLSLPLLAAHFLL